jgi:hypothetical protein
MPVFTQIKITTVYLHKIYYFDINYHDMYDKRKIIDDVAKMTLEIFTSDFGFW